MVLNITMSMRNALQLKGVGVNHDPANVSLPVYSHSSPDESAMYAMFTKHTIYALQDNLNNKI